MNSPPAAQYSGRPEPQELQSLSVSWDLDSVHFWTWQTVMNLGSQWGHPLFGRVAELSLPEYYIAGRQNFSIKIM